MNVISDDLSIFTRHCYWNLESGINANNHCLSTPTTSPSQKTPFSQKQQISTKMHYQFFPCFLLAFFTSLLPASASPLYYSPSPRDNNQIRSTRTTICLSDYFGGCCAIDEHGNYGSCMLPIALLIYYSPSNLSSYITSHSQYFFPRVFRRSLPET